MNLIDYAIGIGLGVLMTLIISSIKKSKEDREKEEKSKYNNISERFRTLENKTIDNYYDLKDRIDKLEKLTKPLNEISIQALHDNCASVLIALSKRKRK